MPLKRELKKKMQDMATRKNRQINRRDARLVQLERKCSILALAFHLFADDAVCEDSNEVLKRYKRQAAEILNRTKST